MSAIAVETQGFQFLSVLALLGAWIYVIKSEKWMGFIFVVASLLFVAIGFALSLVGGPLALFFGSSVIEAAVLLFWTWLIALCIVAFFVRIFSFGNLGYGEAFRLTLATIFKDFINVGLVLVLSVGWFYWVFYI